MSPHSEFAAMAVTRLRNAQHSDHAFDICEEIFAEAIAAERERCAKVCESSAKRYEELAIAARESRGPLSNSEANEYMWAAECARQQASEHARVGDEICMIVDGVLIGEPITPAHLARIRAALDARVEQLEDALDEADEEIQTR